MVTLKQHAKQWVYDFVTQTANISIFYVSKYKQLEELFVVNNNVFRRDHKRFVTC